MFTIKRFLPVLALLFAGCTSLDLAQRETLREAAHAYSEIGSEMTRQQIVAQLGTPQYESESSAKWEVKVAPRNFESLEAEFSVDGHVRKLTRTSKRFAAGPLYQGERSVVYGRQN